MEIVERIFKAGEAVPVGPEVRFEGCTFEGVDFTGLELAGVEFVDCGFADCAFANVKVLNVTLRRVKFESCDLMGVNWTQARRLEELRFFKCRLDFGVFQEIDLSRGEMKECSAKEVDFADADLRESDLSGSDFTRATFMNTKLAGADLRNAKGYVFDVRTTLLNKTKLSLPEAAGLLVALGAEIED